MARQFGYDGKRAWDRHRHLLVRWIGPFFDIKKQKLVRKQ
jgi:hypothetical protein